RQSTDDPGAALSANDRTQIFPRLRVPVRRVRHRKHGVPVRHSRITLGRRQLWFVRVSVDLIGKDAYAKLFGRVEESRLDANGEQNDWNARRERSDLRRKIVSHQ